MASCCRRYRARRLKALGHDPQLLVVRPAPPATSLNHLKPFKLSTALMAVHKDCYAPIGLIQQGGPRRRETLIQWFPIRIVRVRARWFTEFLPDNCWRRESPRTVAASDDKPRPAATIRNNC